jgi:ribosome-associated toxin RatA of RatAB toxin-antitoxin module
MFSRCSQQKLKGCGILSFRSFFLKAPSPISHQDRKLLRFPLEHCYNVVSDVDKYEEFIPWCMKSRVISREGENKLKAELTVGFQLYKEKYLSHVELKRNPFSVVALSDTNLFEYLKSEWKFTPSSSDARSTWVSFQIDFKFKSSLYNGVSEVFLQEVAKKMMQAFEQRCKQLSNSQGKRKPSLSSNTSLS